MFLIKCLTFLHYSQESVKEELCSRKVDFKLNSEFFSQRQFAQVKLIAVAEDITSAGRAVKLDKEVKL